LNAFLRLPRQATSGFSMATFISMGTQICGGFRGYLKGLIGQRLIRKMGYWNYSQINNHHAFPQAVKNASIDIVITTLRIVGSQV
jgi:hypothetical protein